MQIRTVIFLWRYLTCFVISLHSEAEEWTITCIILEESPLPGSYQRSWDVLLTLNIVQYWKISVLVESQGIAHCLIDRNRFLFLLLWKKCILERRWLVKNKEMWSHIKGNFIISIHVLWCWALVKNERTLCLGMNRCSNCFCNESKQVTLSPHFTPQWMLCKEQNFPAA